MEWKNFDEVDAMGYPWWDGVDDAGWIATEARKLTIKDLQADRQLFLVETGNGYEISFDSPNSAEGLIMTGENQKENALYLMNLLTEVSQE